ncbi:hypothetical protein [Bogoriella caseilytica]|uniref:Uncharacterized protein n=1 Tax=Bogoriella caseilytica TaxID=56055 RepID=A0A3N2BE24_9MICO|nr:hypothetical protein [Bogoriella caseilytica]ROR73500.1 hypothetical protein EDD31_1885 [Bogoriella caseilytica]
MRRSIRPLAPLAGVLLASTALTACGNDGQQDADFEDAPAQEESTAPDPEPTADPEDQDNEDDDADNRDDTDDRDDAGEAIGPLDPQDAIETISYELPGDSSTTVDVGLHGLRVEGEVMLLELSFTGQFYGNNPMNIYAMMGGSVYPELNDREHLKQYTVIGTGHDRWSTPSTNAGHRYESGQTAPYWAYYAAPVDDIDTITVTVIPGAVEFEDVEIER